MAGHGVDGVHPAVLVDELTEPALFEMVLIWVLRLQCLEGLLRVGRGGMEVVGGLLAVVLELRGMFVLVVVGVVGNHGMSVAEVFG